MAPAKYEKRKGKDRSKSLPGVAQTMSGLPRERSTRSPLSRTQQAFSFEPASTSSHREPFPVSPKLQKRFYEALVMLEILGKNRGDRVDEEEFEIEAEPNDLGNEKLRRAFLRSISYLCDYERGGDSATAFAMQQTPRGIVYWMASNDSKKIKGALAKSFAREILESLKQLKAYKVDEIEADLFEKAVKFSSRRISDYARQLRQTIQFVLNDLSKSGSDENASFSLWLRNLEGATKVPDKICQLCYDSRRSSEYAEIRGRAKAGEPCAATWNIVRHLIGRLNHTIKAIKIVVEAGLRLPYLFDDVEIQRAKSSRPSSPPLIERNPTLFQIAGRLAGDQQVIEQCRHDLEELDQRHRLSEKLHLHCTSESWRPRVHAELILLDFFWTKKFEFVDQDRYIGCSKPACYCCYHYITAHPGRFVSPACHNNIWLNWKAPEIFNSGQKEHIKIRENILNNMAQRIRIDVFAQIKERRGPATHRPDSLTEISTLHRENHTYLETDSEGAFMSEGDLEEEESAAEFTTNDPNDGNSSDEDVETEDDEDGGVPLLESLMI